MPVERSAGIIIFVNSVSVRKYLVIRSSRKQSVEYSRGRIRVAEGQRPKARYSHAEFWDFPKGQLEKGETGIDAARREAKEEARISSFEILSGFKETVSYFTRREGKPIPKFVAMFLAEAKSDKVKLSWEHDKYEWLPYEEAYSLVSLPQMKNVLKKADNFLKKYLTY